MLADVYVVVCGLSSLVFVIGLLWVAHDIAGMHVRTCVCASVRVCVCVCASVVSL